jgi:CRP-like cAMP-binding protein
VTKENNHIDCSTCKVFEQSIFFGLLNDKGFAKKLLKFTKGDYLFHENTDSDGVFCLRNGLVQLLKKDNSDQSRLINIARPGELLGVSSVMLPTSKYSTSAIAFKTTEACFITKNEILSILKKHPKTALNLMRMISGKVKEMEPSV